MRVILDTNVIISRYLTPHGRVARIIDLWEADAFDLVVSEVILGEYSRVLRYPRHRRVHQLSDEQLLEIEDAFRLFTEPVEPDPIPAVISKDPDDDHFIAASVSARVDALVTGDPHLLELETYGGIPILSPAEFLARFFPE
jgi:putative PIN family toxin of toxin-antitoxin system